MRRKRPPPPSPPPPPPPPLPARIRVLYEGYDGEPRGQWQYKGRPRVPGCIKSDVSGHISPPPFRWVVRAKSAKQACFFVHRRARAFGRRSLGILWDRTTA